MSSPIDLERERECKYWHKDQSERQNMSRSNMHILNKSVSQCNKGQAFHQYQRENWCVVMAHAVICAYC